ncbi:MAG: ATP-binding protein [Acidimicrobiales bacterium]
MARTLEAVPASVASARRFAAEATAWLPAGLRDAVVLMVSELATNCAVHAGGEFKISIEREARFLRVEVADRSPGEPVPKSPQLDDLHGRGLLIVEQLSDEWGVERRDGSKTVWFRLVLPAS